MLKKTVAAFMAAAMTFGGGAAIASAEETAAPALTLDFEDESALGGALYGMAMYATAGGGKSGEGYISLPGAEDAFSFNFAPEEGGDDANYILSFWSKTSVGENLFVETTPYVDYRGTLMDWHTYRKDMGLPSISNGEGKSYLVTGLATADGGEWVENRLEFRVPEGCDRLQVHIGSNFTGGTTSWVNAGKKNVEDLYRAIDNLTITKTEYNLVRNGDFEGFGHTKNGARAIPYSNWNVGNPGQSKLVTENGDTKIHLGYDGGRGPQGVASYMSETVYLYPGKYEISYNAKQIGTQGRMRIGLSGVKSETETVTILGKYLYRNIDAGPLNFAHRHYGYFEVTEPLAYTLQFNNGWLGGEYVFDNIKIVPFDETAGSLYFGEIYTTEDVNATSYNTWNPDSTALWFMAQEEKALKADDTVAAFGKLPSDSATGAQVITAVYKVTDGKKLLMEMQVDAGVPGKGFKGSAVTVPETQEGESVLIKAMVMDSTGTIRPLGDDFTM